MKPIKFKEQNCTFAENQPEYIPLPAFKYNNKEGQVVSCWRFTFMERIKLLFTGKIWMMLMMFDKPLLTPSLLSLKKSDVLPTVRHSKWKFTLRNVVNYITSNLIIMDFTRQAWEIMLFPINFKRKDGTKTSKELIDLRISWRKGYKYIDFDFLYFGHFSIQFHL